MSALPQLPKYSWIHPELELRTSSIHGQGLFSKGEILTGEEVIIFGGFFFSAIDILKGKADARTLIQVNEKKWFGDKAGTELAIDYFINHSCDPNLWFVDQVTLVARKPILPGTEVTIDYCTEYSNPEWGFRETCKCGSKWCRKMVTGNDWMLPALQKRYSGHFIPYLNKKIEALQDKRDRHRR